MRFHDTDRLELGKASLVRRRHGIACLLACLAAAGPATGAAITGRDVNGAIARGVQYLKSLQRADGSWPYTRQSYVSGASALAVFTLVNAGAPANDPAVQSGAVFIATQPLTNTYATALTAMALAKVDPATYGPKIQAARNWLMAAQYPNGAWSYTLDRRSRFDNSNTQFAVLGLRAAQQAGFPAPKEVWSKIDHYFRGCQNRDGGWGYRTGRSYGSMTAAGLSSLFICNAQSQREIKYCGQHSHDADITRALNWFHRHYCIASNPQTKNWYYYYLYALERVGVLSARRRIGGHDWYREGAACVVQMQNPQGGWGGGLTDTCFAMLFLAKGKAPVLVHKLRRRTDWNNDPNDIRHLCEFFSQVVGQKVSWQIVDLGMDLSDLLAAPVLYFNGHKAISFTPEEIKKLRDFVDQGGFIFAEACCGRKEFDRAFRQQAKKLFPDQEFVPLGPEHPIYRSFYRLTPAERVPLMGLRAGCHTSLIYSPTDMSCKWEKGMLTHRAFKMGVNILAYATGLEPLRDKLDKVKIIKPTKSGPPPRGAFILAQAKHSGDWDPDPAAAAALLLYMRSKVNLAAGSDKAPVALTSPDLFDYPVLYLVGHYPLELAAEEKARLKLYIERGGFVFAERSCGHPQFDRAFRKLMAEVFPDKPLEHVPLDHPIFSTGFTIRTVKYNRVALKKDPDLTEPWLEGIEVHGRLGLVYSKYTLGVAWANHPATSPGLEHEDALKLGTNVVLYGLTN